MQSPRYVLTQNAQPGMLIEIGSERYLVQAVDVDYPTVVYTTTAGRERVEYGVEARVVTVSAHPAALPASSVTYPVSRSDREAADARTETYVSAVTAAVADPATDTSTIGLRRVCVECDETVSRMTRSERERHAVIPLVEEDWVLVGCEGYWHVDPAVVGMERGDWNDWRETHCGDCPETLGRHCSECAECPRTAGPCWCGAATYPMATAEAHEHFDGCPWVESGADSCDCRESGPIIASLDLHPAVWTPATPDERRHVAVAELVAEVMTSPDDYRYARAYGVLAGLVASGVGDINTRWARDFAAEMNKALNPRKSKVA